MAYKIATIHGMWGTNETLAEVARQIAPTGVEIDHLSYMGHEQFDPNDSDLAKASISIFRDDVIRQLGVLKQEDRLILVGHSMGALLALQAAAKGLAHALVLLPPGAPAGVKNFSPSLFPLIASVGLHQVISIIPWRRPYKPSRRLAKRMLMRNMSEEAMDRVYAGMIGESLRALNENLSATIVAWITFAPGTENPRAVDFEQVTCPIFCVFGDEDRITPVKIGRQLKALLGKKNQSSKFIEVAGAGHWLFEEPCWAALVPQIKAWIEQQIPKQ